VTILRDSFQMPLFVFFFFFMEFRFAPPMETTFRLFRSEFPEVKSLASPFPSLVQVLFRVRDDPVCPVRIFFFFR